MNPYSNKYIYYDNENGIDDDIGICCTRWLANQSTDSTKFGFGISQWTSPERIKGLLEEYYNYKNDDDCTVTNENNKPKCTKNNSKNKISKAESYEIESNYFMKEIENETVEFESTYGGKTETYSYDGFKYIYENWKNGNMKSDRYTEVYDDSNVSNAAMYFCLEFERPKINNESKTRCEIRRENAEKIYQLMIGK